jgi:hypothetical protein
MGIERGVMSGLKKQIKTVISVTPILIRKDIE